MILKILMSTSDRVFCILVIMLGFFAFVPMFIFKCMPWNTGHLVLPHKCIQEQQIFLTFVLLDNVHVTCYSRVFIMLKS
jgi:hypothetical protein